MNIVIPDILTGGMGRTIQGVGAAISGFGTASTKLAGEVQKKYEDQQNLVEASRFENDMLLEKNKSFDDLSKKDDGTDQKFIDKIREADETIGQKYISQASTDAVKNYLSKVHFASQKTNTLKAQEQQEKRLFNTSVENVKIFTDNAIRKSAPYADFDGGISSVDNYIAAQAGYFGASTGELSKTMKARFAENMVKTSLNDPVAAPVILRRLSDQTEREKIFAHIPVEKLDEIERMMTANNNKTVVNKAYADVTNQFTDKTGKIDYKAAASAALAPEFAEKHNLTIDQQQNISQSLSLRYSANETARKDLQEKNLNGLQTLAMLKPGSALEKVKTFAAANDGSFNMEELYKFQKALETHIRQLSLMSAQEKQIQMDMEDKGMAAIKVNILAGAYKSKNEVINAIMSAGFKDTSGKLTEAVNMYEKDRKENFDQINYFKNALDDWDFNITTIKSKATKRDLKDKKVDIEKSLAAWMIKNNVPKSDPKVMEQYRIIKKEALETPIQKALNGVLGYMGFKGNDSFVSPETNGYGLRADGSEKGQGYFGELKRPDGKVSTELSIGVNLGGKEMEIPLLVPTLTRSEVNYLLSGKPATKEITDKAVDHAKQRLRSGKSPFAEKGEQRQIPKGYSETQIRQQLTDKKITGAEQDKWIKIYKDKGIIE